MKCRGLLLLLIIITLSCGAQRVKYNFNHSWEVARVDSPGPAPGTANFKKVTLPYAWNEDEAFQKDIADLSTGIVWYQKNFVLPSHAKGRKIFIEFEGVRQAADIYVNGKPVGMHENGVTAFGFDITPFVLFDGQVNNMAVRTNNSWDYREQSTNTKFQWIDKNFNANYGGICKNVYLHITGKIYQTLPLFSNLGTTGVYVYAKDFDIAKKSATITAAPQVKNETGTDQVVTCDVILRNRNNRVVKKFSSSPVMIKASDTKSISASASVHGLQFWSWGYGYLYDVQTLLTVNGKIVDSVTTRTGFRKTEFGQGMIRLNDRIIQIHGYAQRTSNEWPAIGMSVPAWLSDYSNQLIIESNGNLVRWMHITPWKQDVESCDRVGLLQAMPAGDAERDVTDTRWEQRKAVMRDAIIYNRNNPSIIFYECGNENISEAHMKEMKAIRDAYDPYGGRAIGSREMLDSREAEYGGEMLYINKSARLPVWAMEYSRDEGLRKYWDDYSPPYHKDGDGPPHRGQPAKEYNRNQESHAIENVIRWHEYWKERPGTGKRVSSGGVNIIFSETNTHHRGAENYRRSGEVDALRIPKENFYAHQVMWDGWVDIERSRIHIIGHWNYNDTTVKDIYVISSADKVQLFINDNTIGYGEQQHRFLYVFKNIKWQPGSISAKGYSANGKLLCETKKATAGSPEAIRLRSITHPRGLQADGHDLALVEFEVIDNRGNRCPVAMNMIDFTLNGEAEWRGGMAQGPGNFILAKSLPVECGVNRVLIRSTTKAGKIQLTASSPGLRSASLTLQSMPVIVKQGLGERLPADGLPGYLGRGPTPLTPAFLPSRKALPVSGAIAGANGDSVLKSYDDNEMSDWHNDGQLSTAWIEYHLEYPSIVNEITLKLNNFRSRTYPLRITVDGTEVFNDTTRRSLGYFTAICKPVMGKKVKIQLITGQTAGSAEKMIEVSGKKLDDGVNRDDANAKGMLSIIEAEIYQTINKEQ